MEIKKASKKESKLRLALVGSSGAGKTYTALAIGSELGQKILVADTERGSASKYADLFDFDVVELDDFSPERFIEIIDLVNRMPDAERYDVLIIDSLSHAWMGRGGILEQHTAAEKRKGNKFTAWADVTPKHNALVEAILQAKTHVIATMRAKTEYAMEQENGKTRVRSVGLAPVQRDGMEYEFDIVAQLDIENNFIVQKTRCPMLSGKIYHRAGADVAEVLKIWLAGEKTTVVRMPEISQRIDENQELIGEIKNLLKQLGKTEENFAKWFQGKYDTDLDWTRAGVAVKREVANILRGWLDKATAA